MKKTLVALAALAVVGAASAQSSVTLYGRIDAVVINNTQKINGVKTPGANVGLQVNSAGYTGSRWGLRGTEDLGGGLRANFQLEQAFAVDNGSVPDATKQFRRQAWVGLSGGFGAITAGRQYGMIDNHWGNYDAQELSGFSALNHAFNNNGFGDNGNTCDGGLGVQQNITNNTCAARINNSLIYTTPAFVPGLTGQVMWAPGENKGVAAGQPNGSYKGVHVNYVAGPLGVRYARDKVALTIGSPAPTPSQSLWTIC